MMNMFLWATCADCFLNEVEILRLVKGLQQSRTLRELNLKGWYPFHGLFPVVSLGV